MPLLLILSCRHPFSDIGPTHRQAPWLSCTCSFTFSCWSTGLVASILWCVPPSSINLSTHTCHHPHVSQVARIYDFPDGCWVQVAELVDATVSRQYAWCFFKGLAQVRASERVSECASARVCVNVRAAANCPQEAAKHKGSPVTPPHPSTPPPRFTR